ncbi:hypothetical protein LR48_Vigan10s001800 [Vigna angularis]|uniref:Uncharacterized protein n=1 Tax=Phaseolus angularis TaxID=3914 RepID=A0A0L9T473_PHAAN|nr:hypothetical protein LR48_Vigan10s001800 [Vigna angularis]
MQREKKRKSEAQCKCKGFRVNLVKEVKKERDEIRKDTKKCKKEKPQVPLNGSLPLSGTQELTGGPLRGKMAAEGKNRADALTAERHYFGLGPNFM